MNVPLMSWVWVGGQLGRHLRAVKNTPKPDWLA
jgi:hypothetical protein